ncbi:SusC/RagA family TonB-linked outer membrane protein [Lunatibacter salilacus]|uniref:SusC/RagA family TonB-linked outer membrane protein n=1 Tax=Lunatibacter salilacus TaxID=2483804 RepID=UPI00131E8C55|nr:TonB-dependent receptor [Lunatibacter salilacus]
MKKNYSSLVNHSARKWLSVTLALILLITTAVLAQDNQTITGRVVSADEGLAVPGATVLVKNTSIGAITDMEGNFTIQAGPNTTLIVSFIGFETAEIPVGNRSVIDVMLNSDTQTLDEFVVTGYTTQQKKDITGAVSVVDVDALKSVPAGSAVQALQGQAAGVNVISSGSPGSRSNIFVRGIGSFGDTQPLVIIDGIQADLNDVSAYDVESIQVLKDAGAAAIYGVRGANGVIIVTTKKGKSGAPVFSYDSYYSMQMPLPGNPFDIVLDSQEFARLALIADPNNALFRNGVPDFMYSSPAGSGVGMAGDPVVDPSRYLLDLATPGNSYLIQEVNKPGTNWFQELFTPAPMSEQNLTVSGGNDNATYMVSLGYLDQQGTLINTSLKRYTARINTTFKLGKHVRIGENLNIYYRENPSFTTQNQFQGIAGAYSMMPIVPTRDIAGNYGGTRAGINLGSNLNTIAAQERAADNMSRSWNLAGNVYGEVDILKNFTARTTLAGVVTNAYNYGFNFTAYENIQGFLNPNSYNENSAYSTRIMWTNTLNYSKQLGLHSINLLLGTESIANQGRSVGGSRENYYSTDVDYRSLSTGTTNIQNYSSFYEDVLFSKFSRLDYSYNDRYLLGMTIRRDGSSKFGPESRFGMFPSFSLGWRISEEGFMQNLTWLNDLKLRGSYGILGSQNNVNMQNQFNLFGGGIANAYYDIRGTSNSVIQGFFQTRNGNPRTGWERNIISNFGIDASILDNKLDFSFEYYRKSIDGLLFVQPVLATAGGATPPTINIGDIQNSGVDFSLTYKGNINNNFEYSIGGNITAYENLIVSIPEPGYFDVGFHQQLGNMVRNQQGHPVSSFFGYEVIGLFNSEEEVNSAPTQSGAEPGRFRYRDVNGDGQITPEDRTFIGNPNPDFTYGININLAYKGFDLSTILYGSQGNDAVNTIPVYTHFFGTYVGAKSNVLSNAWTPENTNTNVPKVENQNSFSTAGAFNSYLIEDASYLRMRTLTLGYTFNSNVLNRIKASRLRVYTQAVNLFTITNYTGLDPELAGNSSNFGIDIANYPNNQRSFLLGLNVSF